MIDRDEVVHEIVLAAPPHVVFAHLIDPEKLVRWIGLTAELDPRPGGVFRFEVVPGEFCQGSYVEVDPPRRVVFTWGWTNPMMQTPPSSSTVDVTLKEFDGGTWLRLVHRGLGAAAQPMHDDGWSQFLARLVGEIAGGDAGPYPLGEPEVLRRDD